jgi:hypothetical protein
VSFPLPQGSFRNTGSGECHCTRRSDYGSRAAAKNRLLTAEDGRMASAVFALFSLILAACSVALGWAGVKVAIDGQPGGAAFLITIGVVTLYGTYLFARTAWRARKSSANDDDARTRQRSGLRFTAWYILACVAIALALPVSGLAKVVIGVMAVAGSTVALAARIDPPRRSKR